METIFSKIQQLKYRLVSVVNTGGGYSALDMQRDVQAVEDEVLIQMQRCSACQCCADHLG